MNCYICSKNKMTYKKENLEFISEVVGSIMVPNIKFLSCSVCGEQFFDSDWGDKWINYALKKEQEAINGLPIEDFIPTRIAAEYLNMTVPEFRRNHRIKNGLVFKRTINRRYYYHKRSLKLFKKTGKNGKFFIEEGGKQND